MSRLGCASSGGAVTGSSSVTDSRNTMTVRFVARSLPSGDMGPPGAKTMRIPAASATRRTVDPAWDPAPKMCAATALSGITPTLATAAVSKPASGCAERDSDANARAGPSDGNPADDNRSAPVRSMKMTSPIWPPWTSMISTVSPRETSITEAPPPATGYRSIPGPGRNRPLGVPSSKLIEQLLIGFHGFGNREYKATP